MSASETPRTDAVSLDQREGITHPELHETYMAWTDYWALRELARQLERELAALRGYAKAWPILREALGLPSEHPTGDDVLPAIRALCADAEIMYKAIIRANVALGQVAIHHGCCEDDFAYINEVLAKVSPK